MPEVCGLSVVNNLGTAADASGRTQPPTGTKRKPPLPKLLEGQAAQCVPFGLEVSSL